MIRAATEWLRYIREEQPELADDLVVQARYVALLDAPVFSWFRKTRFVDE